MSIFYKNCIISGEVDHYCLLCKEAFTKQDQLAKHIEWINHKKKLKTLTYLKKFQKNKIYKIDHIYYCEVCSEVMHNRSSLCAHVLVDKHKANIEAFSDDKNELPPESSENRRKLVERHEGTEFILLCNLALNNLQWHSIIRNNCCLCDTVVRDINELREHLSSLNHMVRLIQSKCYIYNKEISHFFRKINEDKFYCFVCEKTLPTSSLPTHWEEKEHADSLSTTSSSSTGSAPIDPKVMLVELKLFETQLPYYSVEEDPCKAVCKQCQERLPLKYIKLVKHRKKHIAVSWPTDPPENLSQPKPIDYGQHRAHMAKFAKENFMRTTHGGHRAFCLLCKVHLPATKKKILEHVEGFRHQGFLQIKGHIKSYYKERMKPTKYSTLSEYVEHIFPLPSKSSLIINKLYVIDELCFNLIIRIVIDKHIQKTFCYVCDTYLREDEENDHINDETHQQKYQDVRVLADIDNDFIRKVREFEYHCGYCNELWSSYKGIGNHVSRKNHKLARKYRVLPQGYSKILDNNVSEAQLEQIVDHFQKNLNL